MLLVAILNSTTEKKEWTLQCKRIYVIVENVKEYLITNYKQLHRNCYHTLVIRATSYKNEYIFRFGFCVYD